MGDVIVLTRPGEHVRSAVYGEVRPFPEDVMWLRDERLLDRVVAVEIIRRAPVGITIRIRASSDLDARWLNELDVAIRAAAVGTKTGSLSIGQRLDDDRDPTDIRLLVPLGSPSFDLERFVPAENERITLVSRKTVARTFPLIDLSR